MANGKRRLSVFELFRLFDLFYLATFWNIADSLRVIFVLYLTDTKYDDRKQSEFHIVDEALYGFRH